MLNEILRRFATYPGGAESESEGMESRESILQRTRGLGLVTDDNMLEWRGGRQ
jgi:hypothetical protein